MSRATTRAAAGGDPEVHGTCDPALGEVLDTFRSVISRTLGGAAFSVIVDGSTVVSLSGGWADRARTVPWRVNTGTTVFSGSKGLVSMCLALLLDRGQLDLDAPVCRYWPEFAAAGKERVTVREIASHTAGLPALSVSPSVRELCDPARCVALLAQQRPHPRLAGVPCYHALTFGWLCAEIVRRITGMPLGEFFRREIAEKAAADVRFGVPSADQAPIADLFVGAGWEMPEAQCDPKYASRIFGDPELWAVNHLAWNRPVVRAAEIPAAGAIGTAEGMARCYAAFVDGLDGAPALVSRETLDQFTGEQSAGIDPCFGDPLRFGVGFQLQSDPLYYLGPPLDAFGHSGAGGSSHGWWPSGRVAFSFVMNEMLAGTEDVRARDLLGAVHRCLDADEARPSKVAPYLTT
jgi:CubicO group peptidase (beta-lactamase class C family)